MWAKRDEAGTRAARKAKEFVDRRSWKGWRSDGTPFIRLRGADKKGQYERLWLQWDGNCANCHDRVFPGMGAHIRAKAISGFELDHIRSLGRGGDDSDGNLQFLCVRCHRAKHNREIHLRTIPAVEEQSA